ncbi:hypothetical protein QBC43DRAFT_223624 [Cladorrhinum sp. PSN259]|nr:hypothetical protein QBC43DRAFT_223624 [Cladorrhinum sp. PSN259]
MARVLLFLHMAFLAAISLSSALPNPTEKEPPQYTGPCSNEVCGAKGKPCRVGLTCVPYPNFPPGPRYGCTCSYM